MESYRWSVYGTASDYACNDEPLASRFIERRRQLRRYLLCHVADMFALNLDSNCIWINGIVWFSAKDPFDWY